MLLPSSPRSLPVVAATGRHTATAAAAAAAWASLCPGRCGPHSSGAHAGSFRSGAGERDRRARQVRRQGTHVDGGRHPRSWSPRLAVHLGMRSQQRCGRLARLVHTPLTARRREWMAYCVRGHCSGLQGDHFIDNLDPASTRSRVQVRQLPCVGAHRPAPARNDDLCPVRTDDDLRRRATTTQRTCRTALRGPSHRGAIRNDPKPIQGCLEAD